MDTFRTQASSTLQTDEVLPTVPQTISHTKLQVRPCSCSVLASLCLSGLLAWSTGAALAHTEALDKPAQAIAAILLEITPFN